MAMTTAGGNLAFLPTQVHDLIVQPVVAGSVAIQAIGGEAAVIYVNDTANTFRVPVVTEDPTAAWTAEGSEIAATAATLSETSSGFFKLAGLTIITRELANDSSPAAAQIVGAGLARDIARKLDAAFFGSNVTDAGPPVVRNAAQPAGLEDLTGFNAVAGGAAGASWTNLDPFAAAIAGAENVGAELVSFTAHPDDALLLAQLKDETGSNRPLLGVDPTTPTRRLLQGVPLLPSPAVTEGTIWGIPRGRVLIVIREDVRLDVDRSAYFTSDKVAIRATLRCTFLHPHPAAVQKVKLVPAG